jgi:hypothetical protein
MRFYLGILLLNYVLGYPFLDSLNIKTIKPTKVDKLFKRLDIYNDISLNIQSKMKNPIILNGPETPLKKDFIENIFESSFISVCSYSFNKFVFEKPYIFNINTAIFVDDFLINDGRQFNKEESDILLNLRNNANYIIFNANNIETIPYQDKRINGRFEVLNFPLIGKKDLVHYIYDIIHNNEFNDDMFCIDWEKYDIDLLSLSKINSLVKDVEHLLKFKMEYNINNYEKIHFRIESLVKYYVKYNDA